MNYQAIMKAIPVIQSAQLVEHNLKKVKKKKVNTKDILDLGMTNIIGTSMIKINADLIGTL